MIKVEEKSMKLTDLYEEIRVVDEVEAGIVFRLSISKGSLEVHSDGSSNRRTSKPEVSINESISSLN